MIRSMTGFGRAQVAGDTVTVTVEARSVNHRHLDIALKLPRTLAALEGDVRRAVQGRFERGRIELTVTVSPPAGAAGAQVSLDVPLARTYLEFGRRLAAELALPESLTLGWLMDRPGVMRLDEADPPPPEAVWPVLAEALDDALAELRARREAEGEALTVDLWRLHATLGLEVARMAGRAPHAEARQQARLRQRLEAILDGRPVDETRVLTEVAIWAEKADVSEELTRLRAHLEQMAALLGADGPVGRTLDFLIQEMHREVNTIGSKADDLELSQSAIAAKGLLEKMREQVQNLE
jgi:uncharacterized protein (TIGR00255 family)